MKPLPYYNVAGQQVATHPVSVHKIEGYFRGETDSWLQVHDAVSAPADTAVPLKSWPVQAAYEFHKAFEMAELRLTKGLYVCISTTQATKTLSAEKMDLHVELAQPEAPAGTSSAGDLTTAVTELQVWAESAGPKRLIALEVDGTNVVATHYVQIHSKDTVDAGAVPVAQFELEAGAVKTGLDAWRFGNDGREVGQRDETTPTTWRKGCTVKLSKTAGSYTAPTDGSTVAIKAEYK